MTVLHSFHLPDVGEGLTEAEIVDWKVAVGDTVAINDVLVEIETAKSTVELPSPFAGLIQELHVKRGETVPVGSMLVTVGAESDAAATDEQEDKPLVLVGTGPSAPAERRRRLSSSRAASTPADGATAGPQADPVSTGSMRALAAPPVRFLAKRLGVDLETVAKPNGGIIKREDVERAAGGVSNAKTHSPIAAGERRLPVKGVLKAMASAMVQSAFTAPHVTEWLTVDVTATMQMVARLKQDPRWQGVRVSPLLFVAKALVLSARRNPLINGSWDEANQEVVEKSYVNLGIAAATPRGLLVPNIKDAHEMDMRQLAEALDQLITRARSGLTNSAEMSAGTITITNIGALGVDAGTPILNPGEAAILAFGAVRQMPWVVDGEIVPRHVTQLALSFDHRFVDGELGSRVLTDVGRLLHDPGEALLYV